MCEEDDPIARAAEGLGYGDNAKAAYILDTPGPTPATFRHVRYKRLQRPYFPADEGQAFSPTILS